jgi:protein-S-isoprenylcysteine O-methyltransferase Ste14
MSVLGFILTVTVWYWILNQQFARTQQLFIVIGGALAVFPVVGVGRRLLDSESTIDRAAWVTAIVHFAIMVCLGAATIEAVRAGQTLRTGAIPFLAEVGLGSMIITGIALLLTVVNLALQGLGAPFAIALSRRLATGWMYAWTRNPMVLSLLAFLVSLGIWLCSVLFLLFALVLFTPVMVVYLKAYEERELEIRFGPSYLDYKSRTSFLWPRKPRKQ